MSDRRLFLVYAAYPASINPFTIPLYTPWACENLTLFLGVGREPRMLCILAKEEVRHIDLVLLHFVTVGKQVSTLQRLGTETEDIVYDKNGLLR